MRTIVIMTALVLSSCQILESRLCQPCSLDVCSGELQCLRGVCVPPTAPTVCENYVPAPTCGEAPPCGDGFECFEGACRTPIDVRLGYDHGCVLWASGKVSCWGSNQRGQLGVEDLSTHTTAVQVEGIDDAVELGVGADFNCVRNAVGEVRCWGRNLVGELGNFRSDGLSGRLQSTYRPQSVVLREPALSIHVDERRACAIVASGALYCWGEGGYGYILGDDRDEHSELPIEVLPQIDTTHVGLSFSNTVWERGGRAWGIGTDYRGSMNRRAATTEPVDLGFSDVRRVRAGYLHTCIQQGPRRVRCSGWNSDSGTAFTMDNLFRNEIEALVSQGNWSCAKTVDGPIACWGEDQVGQLGTFMFVHQPLGPEVPVEIAGTHNATRFDIGTTGFGCFIEPDDGVYCWGYSADGKVGDGKSQTYLATALSVEPLTTLSAGTGHHCGLNEQGFVFCWGWNRYGQLGAGFRSGAEPPVVVPGLVARQVAAGFAHTCAVDHDDQVWCWGRDGGHLNETAFDSLTPIAIDGWSDVVSITTGWHSICALRRSGVVSCLSNNFDNGATTATTATWLYEPWDEPTVRDPAMIVTRNRTSCALHSDGRIQCWGAEIPGVDPELTLPGTVDLVLGTSELLALQSDGTILGLGQNTDGNLGNGTARTTVTPKPIVDLDDATQVSSNGYHSCALKEDGSVVCWGADEARGLLGSGPQLPRHTPVEVPGLPPATQVAAGTRGATCILSTEGAVWCWGWNRYGSVTGEFPTYATPVRVPNLEGRGAVD